LVALADHTLKGTELDSADGVGGSFEEQSAVKGGSGEEKVRMDGGNQKV